MSLLFCVVSSIKAIMDMTVTIGDNINGYIIKKHVTHKQCLDVFEVVDKSGQLLCLKMFQDKDKILKSMLESEKDHMVKPFVWQGKLCIIHGEQDSDSDYFTVDFERAGTTRNKHYGDKIVRTPMPFHLPSDSDDDRDEMDDEYDDDNESDYDDDDDYEDDEGDNSSQGFFDDGISKFYTCESTDAKVGIPSILLSKDWSSTNCHIEIETPRFKNLHEDGLHEVSCIQRTPIPPNVDHLAGEKEFARKQEQSGYNFELKMVASAMLKRREAKSLAT